MREDAPRLAAISVDLDEIDCYLSIHGLPLETVNDAARQGVYLRALPRLEAFFDDLDIPATFFVIGRHLDNPDAARAVLRLHRAGHEIGNHTQQHPYGLSRLPSDQQLKEVSQARDAICALTGSPPAGFRAPGYVVHDALLQVVAETGHLYDSSVFPCPAYYAAKAAAILAIRARGRRSHSLIDDPRVLLSPANPYRIGARYWRRGAGLAELPIGVTGGWTGRLPYIGTSLMLAGPEGSRWLTRAIAGRPLINLELHGIDLSDATTDGLRALQAHQPDLRIALERKLVTLHAAVSSLRSAGYQFVTLDQARRQLFPTEKPGSSAREERSPESQTAR